MEVCRIELNGTRRAQTKTCTKGFGDGPSVEILNSISDMGEGLLVVSGSRKGVQNPFGGLVNIPGPQLDHG